jgi:hypothetical protein
MQQASSASVFPARGTETSGGAAPLPTRALSRELLDAQGDLGCLVEIARLVHAQAGSEAPDRLRRLATLHASLTHVADTLALGREVLALDAPAHAQASAPALEAITGQLDLVATCLESLALLNGRSPRDELLMQAVLERLEHAHDRLQTLLTGDRT